MDYWPWERRSKTRAVDLGLTRKKINQRILDVWTVIYGA